MKLMDRYIFREMIIPFLAGSIAIALLFSANQLIYILRSFNSQMIPASAMVQMLLYRLPFWLNMTLPAGVTLGASLAITRLSRESEITAMRAGGVRITRLLVPVVLFGVVVSIGNYLLIEKVIPRTDPKAHKLEVDSAIVSATGLMRSNVWLDLKGRYKASFSRISRKGEDILEASDVFLGERPEGDTVRFITAPKGTYHNGIWTLGPVTWWELSPGHLKLTHGTGDSMTISQPIFLDDLFDQTQSQEKTGAELAASIKAGKLARHDMTREEVAYYQRFSIPAACIVFAVISPIFSLMFSRTGSFAGLLVSFILVLIYYNAFVVSSEIIGPNHWLPPALAAWAPNILFVALGLIGVRRLE